MGAPATRPDETIIQSGSGFREEGIGRELATRTDAGPASDCIFYYYCQSRLSKCLAALAYWCLEDSRRVKEVSSGV